MKTSLTKAYNNGSHRSQVLVGELAAKIGKKGKARAGGGADAEEEAGLLGEEALDELALLAPEDEGEEDDEDVSALFAAKKPAKKAAAKAPAKTKESAASKSKAKAKG